MNSRMLSMFCFVVLLSSSSEDSVAFPNTPATFKSENSSTADAPSEQPNRADGTRDVAETDPSGRDSRMMKTTLGYDEWWFLTTSRPFISYKDFPGKPGVASWKEISSNSSTDSRKSRKMSNPTAAGVTSSSYRILPPSILFFIYFLTVETVFLRT